MKPLLELNMLINQIENYYGSQNIRFTYVRLDAIMELKKKVARIASFPVERHPEMILTLSEEIRTILPCRQNPVFPYYRDQLKSIQNSCYPNGMVNPSKLKLTHAGH